MISSGVGGVGGGGGGGGSVTVIAVAVGGGGRFTEVDGLFETVQAQVEGVCCCAIVVECADGFEVGL